MIGENYVYAFCKCFFTYYLEIQILVFEGSFSLDIRRAEERPTGFQIKAWRWEVGEFLYPCFRRFPHNSPFLCPGGLVHQNNFTRVHGTQQTG